MEWLNKPPFCDEQGSKITITSGPQTDFWRKTHDGGIRHTGHFYYETVHGDFIAEVKVSGQYVKLYDQAGLMVRQDETVWMKCGIEFFQGVQHASVVVTRDFSDWSVLPLPQGPESIWLRVIRIGPTLEVNYSLDGNTYTMIRQTTLSAAESVQVGVMLCAPIGEGVTATFEGFTVRKTQSA
jgi:regulation of enolase protein 1 (concanavalin A-like superfamily)